MRLRIGTETSVAFRSAKERDFRGAKGDIPTVIDLSVLSTSLSCGHLAARQGQPQLPPVLRMFTVGLIDSDYHPKNIFSILLTFSSEMDTVLV